MRTKGYGGIVGSANNPSTSAAPGCWPINSAARQNRTGTVLRWPTEQDPSFASVTFLCHFDEWSTIDDMLLNKASGSHSNLQLSNNSTLSAVQAKFRQLSGRITTASGNASFVSGTDAGYNYGAGDFTFEIWVYPTLNASGVLWDQRPTSGNGNYPALYLASSGNLNYYVNSGDRIIGASALLTINTWHHVAVCRASGNTRLFIDGTQNGSTYVDATTYLQGQIVLGNSANASGASMAAYFQEARATKGVARYPANFTPPTTPFPDY